MTASKPEVVAWRALHCSGDWTLREAPTLPSTGLYTGDIEGLIRLTDHERLQAETERLQAVHAADKYLIDQLYRQRDDYAMHNMAVRQCTGIPRSVGISEPVEGFEDRPQDLAPAMREMALIIAAYKARIAELEAALSECAPVMRAHAGASHMLEGFKPQRNEWDDLCDRIHAALAQQGKEGE